MTDADAQRWSNATRRAAREWEDKKSLRFHPQTIEKFVRVTTFGSLGCSEFTLLWATSSTTTTPAQAQLRLSRVRGERIRVFRVVPVWYVPSNQYPTTYTATNYNYNSALQMTDWLAGGWTWRRITTKRSTLRRWISKRNQQNMKNLLPRRASAGHSWAHKFEGLFGGRRPTTTHIPDSNTYTSHGACLFQKLMFVLEYEG